jgi:hypothetical protein
LTHPDTVRLLNVSYPPGEQALVWEISSREACEVGVRISYLLSGIDRVIAYKMVADKAEKQGSFRSFLVVRNFSGEDFDLARIMLDYGQAFDRGVRHEETTQLLFFKTDAVTIEKVWTFDAAKLPWDPERLAENVGIPVSYRVENTAEGGLGQHALWGGKVRVYQEGGHGGTIVLGEDRIKLTPVGEALEVAIGDSRDVVVTQRRMKNKQINIRRNEKNRVVLYDTDELIEAKIENFKDQAAVLTMIQHIPGQWDMVECSMDYEQRDAYTLVFRIDLPAHGKKELVMHYHRRNVRP